MKDLTSEIQAVFQAKTLESKKAAMTILISNSEAKKETKDKAKRQVEQITSVVRLDQFAFNYMASGEGMKVIK